MRLLLEQLNQYRIEEPRFTPKEIHELFSAAIKGYEEEFYPLRKIELLAAIHSYHVGNNIYEKLSLDKEFEKDKSGLPYKRGLLLIYQFLKERPEICGNCFEKHKLEECPNIKYDTRDNFGAYLMPDFCERTGKISFSHLKKKKACPHDLQTTIIQ